MEIGIVWIEQFLRAGIQLWIQPFYYIAVLILILYYRRQIVIERKMFHSKLRFYTRETWRTILWGWVAGCCASFIMFWIGVVISGAVVLLFWLIAILMSFVRIRWISIAYGVGVIGLLHSVLNAFPQARLSGVQGMEGSFLASWLESLENALVNLHMSTLFVLVAILYFIASILILFRKTRLDSPFYMEGKRGKRVGGYHIQGLWPIPLFLFVPAQNGMEWPLTWLPLLGGEVWAEGWTLLAFPVLLGFSNWTQSTLPQEKARWSAKYLRGYSLILAGLAIAVEFWSGLTLLASMLCIGLLEAFVWYSARKETENPPRYMHGDQGLMILGTMAGSPAEEMGILPGEIIRQVNGKKVRTSADLHEALRLSPTLYKLEVINLDGNSKFLQRAVYADDHYQLGMVLAPDEHTTCYLDMEQHHDSLLTVINPKWVRLQRL